MIADSPIAHAIPVFFSAVDGPAEAIAASSDLDLLPIRQLVATGSKDAVGRVVTGPEDLAVLLYTSGSTGRPKGVMYRNIAAGQTLMNMLLTGFVNGRLGGAGGLGSVNGEAHLITVPLFHATGMIGGLLLPCMLAHKVVLMRKWDALTALVLIQAERVTTLSSVPAIVKDLLTHPDFARYDVSTLIRVSAAGAATPADLPGLLRDKLGIIARSAGYGMTETTSVGTTMSGAVFDLKPLSSGIPSPIIDIRIEQVDDGSPAMSGDGEIQLRGVTVTPGYWRAEALTRDVFTRDGWLRTGDLGHLDDDGFLHVTGRIKDIIIRGGENIAPAEIEDAAYLHPGVKEVAVVGVPDDAMGEELAMVCHPFANHGLTEAMLRRHLATVLPKFKVPKHITLTDAPLPRNASEKIHRLAVRRQLVDG